MNTVDRRAVATGDRRAVPRGGRRPYDRPGRFPSLLVADSYDGARVPCARYLDLFGFQVAQAASGQEALQRARTMLPHLILVEASLPDVPAPALSLCLDRDERTRSIPFIVLRSDFDADQTMPDVERAAAVLVKPFLLSAMLQEVRRALRAQPPLPRS